jgi:putative hydrolase of the HAD superfamily
MIKHIFFDLDRTLWDFESNSDKALHQLFFQFQLEQFIATPEIFIETYKKINADYWESYRLGKTTKEALRTGRFSDALGHFKINNKIDGKALGEAYLQLCPTLTQLFPYTVEMLKELQFLDFRLHIITNGFTESQHEKLKNCQLTGYFDQVICSDEIGINKPDKRIFLEALKRANAIAEESVMIGDHPEIDVLGACAAGMRGILFNPDKIPCSPFMEQVNHWQDFTKTVSV